MGGLLGREYGSLNRVVDEAGGADRVFEEGVCMRTNRI